jgi:cob(I)alamin adenosyltransferase
MVRLDRIYTRGGDKGKTSLGDGSRVPKTHPRIAAYGTVDELNAVLGIAARQPGLGAPERRLLQRIQNDLFDVGADLCVPETAAEKPGDRLRVVESQVAALEQAIDGYTSRLEPLRSFILPGGTAAAGWLHLGRVVCRRAELAVAAFAASADTGNQPLVYLNRLSDLLFVMARWANDHGRGDLLWRPGAGREPEAGAADTTAKPGRAASGRERAPRKRARPRRR